MENFDINESWLVKINKNYEEQAEKIHSKDAKFFNTGIFMDFARLTQKFSYDCPVCQENKKLIEDLSTKLSDDVTSFEGRKVLTKSFDDISNHLRKQHKMYIRRYVTSYYTSIALLAGLLLGLIAAFITKNFKFYLLIGGGVGLFVGTIWGNLKERQLIKKEQVYGKY